MKWKAFQKNLAEGNTIDQELQEIIIHEEQKWRYILIWWCHVTINHHMVVSRDHQSSKSKYS